MKYVIIGAGGTGGILGFYMTKAGKDVTLIARNAHLAAMKEQGLTVRHQSVIFCGQFNTCLSVSLPAPAFALV